MDAKVYRSAKIDTESGEQDARACLAGRKIGRKEEESEKCVRLIMPFPVLSAMVLQPA